LLLPVPLLLSHLRPLPLPRSLPRLLLPLLAGNPLPRLSRGKLRPLPLRPLPLPLRPHGNPLRPPLWLRLPPWLRLLRPLPPLLQSLNPLGLLLPPLPLHLSRLLPLLRLPLLLPLASRPHGLLPLLSNN
jgi:hypothetical protein